MQIKFGKELKINRPQFFGAILLYLVFAVLGLSINKANAHWIQTHQYMIKPLAMYALNQDKGSPQGINNTRYFEFLRRNDETYLKYILKGAKNADLRANGLYGIDGHCEDYTKTKKDCYCSVNCPTGRCSEPELEDCPTPTEICSENEVVYNNIEDWPVGDHGYDPFTYIGFNAAQVNKQMCRVKKGTIKNEFRDNDDLVSRLIMEGIIEDVENNPDCVYFDNTIGSETQLRERLEQIGIGETELDLTICIWLQSHNEKQDERVKGLLDAIDGLNGINGDETDAELLERLENILSTSNAVAMADHFYKHAQSDWGKGNFVDAMYNLGIAIHLVQDLSNPQHARPSITPEDEKYQGDSHEEYERKILVDEIGGEATYDGNYCQGPVYDALYSNTYAINLYNALDKSEWYLDKDAQGWTISNANNWLYNVDDSQVFSNSDLKASVSSRKSVKLGVESTVGLIISFFRSVNFASTWQYPVENWALNCNGFWGICYIPNAHHLGVDVIVPNGTKVFAAADGIVKHVKNHAKRWDEEQEKWIKNYGGMVIVEHFTGTEHVTSLYGHLDPNNFKVSVGNTIKKGDQIGSIGSTAVNGGFGEHLHFGIRKGTYDGGVSKSCDGKWTYAGYDYSVDGCTKNDWHDPIEFISNNAITSTTLNEGDVIKFSDSPKIYFVNNEHLLWITDENVYSAMNYKESGKDFSSVVEYNAALKKDIISKYPISWSLIEEGLVAIISNPDENHAANSVYFFDDKKQWRGFSDWEVFLKWGYVAEDIAVITQEAFNIYLPEGDLITAADTPMCTLASGGGEGDINQTFYRDLDEDGYGNPAESIEAYSVPDGYVTDNNDNDDNDSNTYPGATEICDGIDNDQDGQIDENCVNLLVKKITPNSRNLSDPNPLDVTLDGVGFEDTPTAVLRQSGPKTLGTITGMDGDAQDIVISGDYAYVAAGNVGLMIFDISIPGKLHFRSSLALDHPAVGVVVNGDIAYLSMGTDGVSVVDVSDRSNPEKLNSIGTIGTAGKMVGDGNYLYIAALAEGMLIYDISTPDSPTWTGRYPGTETYGMKIVGNMAYIANGDTGILAVNITNKANPYWTGGYNTPGKAYNLYLTNDYCYVADGEAGIQVLSRPTPTSFIPAGTLDTDGIAYDIQGDDIDAYVADGGNGVLIIDVTDPANPTLRDTYNTTDTVKSFAINGDYYYLTNGTNGILALELRLDAPNPSYIGAINTSGSAQDVHVSGNYAYVPDFRSGLQVINVSSPASPLRVKTLDVGDIAKGVYGVGNYVYAVSDRGGGPYSFGGLKVIYNLSIVGSLSTSDGEDVYVLENHAYLADGSYGLKVIDVSDPASPTLVGSLNTSGHAYGIYVVNDYAYLADYTGGLKIIDVSDPANPTLTGSLDTYRAMGVYMGGNYAYLADHGYGLKIIDVSDPTNPTLTGSLDTYRAMAIDVVGYYAYLADGDGGLKIIDISDPEHPYLWREKSVSNAGGVHVVGNYAYVSCGSCGLIIYDLNFEQRFKLADNFEFSLDMLAGAVSGRYLYTAQGDKGLRVYDISQLEDSGARLVSSLSSDDAQGAAISGTNLYLADGASGLRVVDITNPLIPVELGQVDTTDAHSVLVDGDYAYLADGAGGLQVIDVSDPANLTIVGTQGDSDAYRLEKCGDTIYLADGESGLRIIDVSTPSSPTLLGTYDSPGIAYGVAVDCTKETAYLADGDNGVLLLDVSNSSSPLLIGSYDTPGTAHDVLHYGYKVVVADGSSDLRLVDFFDFANPTDLGEITATGDTNDIFLEGNLACIAMGDSGYEIIDFTVQIPSFINPVLVGSMNTTGYPFCVDVVGNYAYVAGQGTGLKVIDVSNPTTPVLIGSIDISYASMVNVMGHYAYVVDAVEGLMVIDVSDLANPILTGSLYIPNTFGIYGIDVAGSHVYLGVHKEGLKVIDVSDPANPVLTGSLDTYNYARGIDVVGNYAYIATSAIGLLVIDVSDPTNPNPIGGLDTYYAYNVHVVGNYAYVTDGGLGLKVIDVSDPAHPTLTGSLDTSNAFDVHVVGNYAYVADKGAGLKVIDVSDPANPVLTDSLDTTSAYSIDVVGNYVYWPDAESLKIIQIDDKYDLEYEVLVSPTQITAKVPVIPKVGLYDLVLTNPDGEKAELAHTLEVADDVVPVLSVDKEAGEYCNGTVITVTSDEDAYIYYTIDGSEPTLNSNSAFKTVNVALTDDFTLKCFAIDRYDNQSDTITHSYIKDITPPVSHAYPASIRLCQPADITLKANEDATIYYTTDGSIPSLSSPHGPAPVTVHVSTFTSINFFAVDACGHQETSPAFHSESYMIAPGPPTSYADPAGGTYCDGVTVKLGFTSYSAIHYTTDGSEPDENSPVYDYQNPVHFTETTSLKFKALDICGVWEAAANTEIYVNEPPAVTSANPPGGEYDGNQTIILATNKTGTTIYYTTDGSEPTTASSVYSTPITITRSTILKYFSVDSCSKHEQVRTSQYIINQILGDNGTWVVKARVNFDEPTMPVSVDGNLIDDFSEIRVFHISAGLFPQIFSVKANGYLRSLPPDMAEVSGGGWGTSFVTTGYWNATSGEYYHTLKFEEMDLLWSTLGSNLQMVGQASDVPGAPYIHTDNLNITVHEPTLSQVKVELLYNLSAAQDFTVDSARMTSHEGFKVAQFSSMHINDSQHDANKAAYAGVDSGWMTTCLPQGGNFIFAAPEIMAENSLHLFHVDDQPRQTPSCSIELLSPAHTDCMPQGWITDTSNPNDDNLGLWANWENVATGYSSGDSIGSFHYYLNTESSAIDWLVLLADPLGGNYCSIQTVSLSTGEIGNSTIYYTTDGSDPNTGSPVYSGSINIDRPLTLKFILVDDCGNSSEVFQEYYNVDIISPITTASPLGGNYCATQSVTLLADETASIYYTTDGTELTSGSPIYSGSISIDSDTTLCFMAVDSCGHAETYHCENYLFDPTVGQLCDGSDSDSCEEGVYVCNVDGSTVECSDNTSDNVEVCEGEDNDCDGEIDEGVKNTYYRDADGDGYGDSQIYTQACSAPQGYLIDNTDCDDNDAVKNPGASEVCDEKDNNCNGTVDEGVKLTFYQDSDSDGYGDATNTIQACSSPSGYVSDSSDCDDSSTAINPGASEVCDGIDNNCDGSIDEGFSDTDADGILDCLDEDDDNDGMPDVWELDNGLNPLVDDTALDPDGDGDDNLTEYNNGTNPQHAPVTYYVDASNTGDPDEDGTQAHPFNTIAETLLPSGAAEADDTVQVTAGTYFPTGDLVIPEGVKLIGERWFVCTIEMGSDYQIQLGSYSTLTGFTISNNGGTRSESMVFAQGVSSVTINNNVIHGNSDYDLPSAPAGIFLDHSSGRVENNTIDEGCIGIRTDTADGSTIVNNIVVNNEYGWADANESDPLVVDYNNFWNNNSNPSGGNNISADPLFVDAESGNYHLQRVHDCTDINSPDPASPCIDGGDPNPIYNDKDGSRNDMGADGGPGGGTQDTIVPAVSADAGPMSGNAPLEVNFTGTADDEWGITCWSWDFDTLTGSQEDITTQNPSYTYNECGGYTARLTVTDHSGFSNSATTESISVDSNTEVIAFASPAAVIAGDPIDFTSYASGTATSYTWSWNFSDGTDPETGGPNASIGGTTHVYVTPGAYTATLTVTDEFGCQTSTTAFVTVINGACNPNIIVAQLVDSNGGTVEANGIAVEISPGVLSEPTVITISELDHCTLPSFPTGISGIGVPVDFGPDGCSFSAPVTITIPYTDADLVAAGVTDPHGLKLYYYDTGTSIWVEIEVAGVDTVNKFISAQIDHFTIYILVAGTPTPPSNLTATAASSSQVDLSWTDNSSDENGFSIERSDNGAATYTEIATVTANQTSYSDAGLSASTQYCYRVMAYNTTGRSAYSNESCATIEYDLSLSTGWNLISLPQQPSDTAIGSVLSSIADKYASVWAFMNNTWKVYDPASPGFSDLTEMEAGWGYWLKMNELATLTVSGSTPSNSISLVSGWNLVGYNSSNSQDIADALASIDGKYVSVWAFMNGAWKVYDPANPGFSDLLTMKPNYGYWINANQTCDWTLP